ncbi:globin domain-containing protein [Geomicrobium sp. JCM 19038]|uniref:globin domain-containing protein n=1 Tax=Geomicrobium sp. JCM 19038 TaxID=1460635 RepID=UPI000693C80A|nr:globin domain-containing protein [Geomicrobium sp. JCM 19038]
MLQEQDIKNVKETAFVFKEYGREIGERFYETLFEQHPELHNFFNEANQKRGIQQRALMDSVYKAGIHIDELESLGPMITHVAEKHRALGVQPEHYEVVGTILLQTVRDVLGTNVTGDVLESWGKAYASIAALFIEAERQSYEQVAEARGGWTGNRAFYVTNRVQETAEVISLYMKPVDHEPLPPFLPGQYVTLEMEIDEASNVHKRHYSLSKVSDENEFRITIQHEPGAVSSHIHNNIVKGSQLQLAAPAGAFSVVNAERPVVFISEGIGLTPLVSMLQSQIANSQAVTWIHATKSCDTHILKEEIESILFESEQATKHISIQKRLLKMLSRLYMKVRLILVGLGT